LGTVQRACGFLPPPQGPAGNGADGVQFALQLFGGFDWNRLLPFGLPAGAQKQIRFGNNTFPYRNRPFAPCRIEHLHFPGGKLIPHNRLGHTFAIPSLGARHRHQVLHGRLRSNVSVTDLLLNRFGKFPHKGQTARYPGRTAIEPLCKFVQAEIETAMQFREQPSLLQGSFPFGRTKRTVQDQCFSFIHVPNRGTHGIAPQARKRPDPLVSVDDDVPVGFLRDGNDYDRYLLTPFGK
jgi:hypothetical protein